VLLSSVGESALEEGSNELFTCVVVALSPLLMLPPSSLLGLEGRGRSMLLLLLLLWPFWATVRVMVSWKVSTSSAWRACACSVVAAWLLRGARTGF
jgi:hypothetical protein